ncbi:pre-mRNA 3'-end-processing factor FIP1 isoform X1 [Pseudochaenichthys georgianus]|uniref:pre-mRNA 3'-end-processing factor FIP1 isoform X1 n=1 Tax=Pseudochaenichthys georgianus TaxID=52239 RepID=UPI00146E7793|nr:pre-mRNA 3'-end-processing factor FIP1 isoform X1 [Pseudochaenichthys georgianus]XP_033937741.1 pre-mRNA 3'-end-processing factor FIP1 isoform X1 [Pseudochaenichthys georgianus]
MSSSELESTDSPVSEDEEGKIYQLIYDLIPANDKEGKEDVQISSGDIPVPLKTDAERSAPHTVAYNDTRALYLEELSYFEETPALNGDTESSAERPWRLSGADITDYFNYGFDEEIWKMYCKKQAEVHAANGKLYLGQKGHTRPSSGSSASRQPSVIGGKRGSSRRGRGHHSQDVTGMSPEADRFSYNGPSPSNCNYLFAFTNPSPYLYRRGPPALSSLDSRHSKGFDDPSTSKPCSSGVSYLIPRNMTLKAGVREAAKAWEFILRQEESENSRERSRKRSLAKGRRRVRDKNRGKCSSSHSGKERNEEERKHSCHSSERVSERPRESSHRDNSEGKKKSSRSSRGSTSKRDGGEDRESQSRNKNKKANK